MLYSTGYIFWNNINGSMVPMDHFLMDTSRWELFWSAGGFENDDQEMHIQDIKENDMKPQIWLKWLIHKTTWV